jgi:hypothetical protein
LLDRIVAFYINPKGPHLLSAFCEYEDEIKEGGVAKLGLLDQLHRFDSGVAAEFDLPPDRLDKYHRSVACFAGAWTGQRRSARPA